VLRNAKTRVWLGGTLAAAALAVPAQALASDQSVYDAWVADDAQYAKLGHDYTRGERHWENSGFQKTGQVYKAVRRTAALAHKTKVRMSHEDPETDLGRKGENYALRSLDLLRASILNRGRAIRAFMRFDGYNYIRLNRKARGQASRSANKESQARKTFKSAGVKVKPLN
jgi:hypothetical protein